MSSVNGQPGFELAEHATLTDVGMRRSHNQDAYGILLASAEEAWRERGHVLLVADGMGAHAVGELASQMASEIIPHIYQKHATGGPVQAIRRAFTEANSNIHLRGQQNREFNGMGTTGTALIVRPEGAWVGHVGDSRAYRVRQQRVEQLSFDHSLQWEMARRQQIAPDCITGIPSNVIIRSLGPEPTVQVDIEGPHPVMPGDVYVLCSDGLSNQVTDQELGAIVSLFPLAEACPFLIDIANLRGGPDNITVVAARVAGETSADDEEPPTTSYSFLRGLPWWKRWPWHTHCMAGGITLGLIALTLAVGGQHSLSILTFTAAVGVLTAGLVGVFRSYQQEDGGEGDGNEPSGPAQVYRTGSSVMDMPLIERFTQTFSQVLEAVKEKGFPYDSVKMQRHQDAFETALKKKDLTQAFKERCRALGVLMTSLRGQRGKDEKFKPNWHGPGGGFNPPPINPPPRDLDDGDDIELEPS
jgi:PPM family protein phosphatase